MTEDTSIRIKRDTWERLRSQKGPGDSFDGVINDLLDKTEDAGQEQVAN
ncbi:DUF7557 family protein [Halovenus marina]